MKTFMVTVRPDFGGKNEPVMVIANDFCVDEKNKHLYLYTNDKGDRDVAVFHQNHFVSCVEVVSAVELPCNK